MKTGNLTKKILAFLLALTLCIAGALCCFAQEVQTVTYTENLGNGFTAVVTLTQTAASGARSSKNHQIEKDYYYNGTCVGHASLSASFNYNGSTASATGASGTGSGANGWSYGGQSVWTSGNGAYLSATLSKNGNYVAVSLSLHCDANGNVS